MTPSGNRDEIAAIRRQLATIDAERQSLEHRRRELEKPSIVTAPAPQPAVAQEPAVTNALPATDKIALFRRLFGGRTDVFPARWDNPKRADELADAQLVQKALIAARRPTHCCAQQEWFGLLRVDEFEQVKKQAGG